MGETIRFLMVAVFVIISVVRLGPEKVSAQGTSGFDIPDSLRGIFADTAESMVDKARAAAGSQPQNVAPPPGFTSSFDDQRASPRVGGPTTDPTSARDSSWLTGPTASGSSRPTTDPYRSTYQGVSPPGSTGTTLVDQVGVRQQPGVIATVSGTQDPLSSEAQMMTLPPRDPNPNAVQQSMPTASGSSRGFGSLPRGVQLPSTYSAQGQTQGAPSTYGSEFGVAGSTWPTGSASNPVFFAGRDKVQLTHFYRIERENKVFGRQKCGRTSALQRHLQARRFCFD